MKKLVLFLNVTAKCWIEEDKGDYWTAPYAEYHYEVELVQLNGNDVTKLFAKHSSVIEAIEACSPETGWIETDCEAEIEVQVLANKVIYKQTDISEFLTEEDFEQIYEYANN